MKKIKAFTLAEVMISMTIIGLLAALVLPTKITGARTKAFKTLYKSTFQQIQNGFVMSENVNKHPLVMASSATTLPNNAKYTIDSFMQHHFDAKSITRDAIADEIPSNQIGKTFELKSGAHLVFTATSLQNMDATGCTNSKPCDAYIDVNGNSSPNSIVVCTTGSVSTDLSAACTVSEDSVKDIFPVIIKSNRIYPKTNAANYVLNY